MLLLPRIMFKTKHSNPGTFINNTYLLGTVKSIKQLNISNTRSQPWGNSYKPGEFRNLLSWQGSWTNPSSSVRMLRRAAVAMKAPQSNTFCWEETFHRREDMWDILKEDWECNRTPTRKGKEHPKCTLQLVLGNRGHVPKPKGHSLDLTSCDFTGAFDPADHSHTLNTFS